MFASAPERKASSDCCAFAFVAKPASRGSFWLRGRASNSARNLGSRKGSRKSGSSIRWLSASWMMRPFMCSAAYGMALPGSLSENALRQIQRQLQSSPAIGRPVAAIGRLAMARHDLSRSNGAGSHEGTIIMKNDATRIRILAGLAIVLLAEVGPASAQKSPADFCSDGEIAVLRLSTLTDGGSRAGYDKAVS